MDPETVFTIATRAVLPGWLLLIFLPRWRWTTRLNAVLVPGLLGFAYLGIFVSSFGSSSGGFNSLEQISALFADPWILLAGWIHYLAFDLFIGAWEVRDSRRLGIRHLLVVPCLGLTLMFGPVGLLLYLVLRALLRRHFWIGEDLRSAESGASS